jgi:mono/diheme cytochrome c family protein
VNYRKLLAITSTATLTLFIASAAAADTAPGAAGIYKAKCASCHGADGAGQTPAGKSLKIRDLRSPEVQKQSDADLQKIMTDGKGKMPAYKAKLSVADIASLVAYIRGMATK